MTRRPDPKTISLAVYVLEQDSREAVKGWLENLSEAAGEDLEITIDSYFMRDEAKLAPFEGRPFVIAGNRASVEEYFRDCTEEARAVFEDCGYYWVLANTDKIQSLSRVTRKDSRVVALSWKAHFYNTVLTRLRELLQFERIAGLSTATHQLRMEIARIGEAEQGAFSPVLILGETGSGKELVASAMWHAFQRYKKPNDSSKVPVLNQGNGTFKQLACGWFTAELLQDQLFGREKGAFTGAVQRQAGLLETHLNGCILLDDFDVAPAVTQGALLRVMSADRETLAVFNRLGGTEEIATNAWLLFATNSDIRAKMAAGEMRPDFIYRFEERVVHLRPLGERLADIPPIARKLWAKIWSGTAHPVNLTASHLQFILAQNVEWEGNVRQLRALLSLAAARARSSDDSLRTILADILSRGGYAQWVGVVLDRPLRGESAGERSAMHKLDFLTPEGLRAFHSICDVVPPSRANKGVDIRVRFELILGYVAQNKNITANKAAGLYNGSADTAKSDLKRLAGSTGKGSLLVGDGRTPQMFSASSGMFRPLPSPDAS